jgi:membrane protease YdiL (CAAX protease family)
MSSDTNHDVTNVPPATEADADEELSMAAAPEEREAGELSAGDEAAEEEQGAVPTSRLGITVLVLLLLLRLVVDQLHVAWAFPVYFFGSYALIVLFIFREPAPLKDFSLILGRFRPAISMGIIFGCLYGLASGFGVAYVIFGHPLRMSDALVVPAIVQSFFGVALIEETAFRGILLGQLRKWGVAPLDAIAVQAIIFAAGQTYALLTGHWVLTLDALVLGVITGALTVRYRTITGAVLASTLVNFLTLALLGGHSIF